MSYQVSFGSITCWSYNLSNSNVKSVCVWNKYRVLHTTLLCSKWRCNQRQPEKLTVYKKDKEKSDSLFDTLYVVCVCLFLRKKIILSRIIIKSLYARLPCLLFLILFTTPFYYRNKKAIKRSVFCQCSFPFLLVLLVTINFLWCSRLLRHVCLKSSGHFSIKHIHISWNLQINKCKRRFYLLSSVQIVFYLRMPEW